MAWDTMGAARNTYKQIWKIEFVLMGEGQRKTLVMSLLIV